MMKQQFLEDTAETFKTYVYENNRKVVPTSATLTVYKPASSEKLIDGQSMTVASDGLLSYSLTADNNDEVDHNYKAVVSYVVSGTTYNVTLFYDVIKAKMFSVVTDEDVVDELPQLKDKGWKIHGTADSGSASTIVDAELKRYADDYFTGGLAYSITQDETREVSDFVSSTGTVTVAEDFSSAVSTDKYILTRSFTKEIRRAFEKLEELLNRSGKRAHLILDPYDLREVHILMAVAEVCKGMTSDGEGSYWWEMWQHYDERSFAVFNKLNLKYDASEDGYISGAEEEHRPGKKTIARG